MLEVMGTPMRYAAPKPLMAAPDGLTLRCLRKNYREELVFRKDLDLHTVIAGDLVHFLCCRLGWHFQGLGGVIGVDFSITEVYGGGLLPRYRMNYPDDIIGLGVRWDEERLTVFTSVSQSVLPTRD